MLDAVPGSLLDADPDRIELRAQRRSLPLAVREPFVRIRAQAVVNMERMQLAPARAAETGGEPEQQRGIEPAAQGHRNRGVR